MTGVDVRIDRSSGLRWLAYAAVTLATLAGLFAMHGPPMTMPTAMPMPSSVAVESSPVHTSVTAMEIAMGATSPAVRMGAVTGRDVRATTASIAASPTAGVHGGCDAEHDGCLATLRGQLHSVTHAPITIASAVADPASLSTDLSRAGLLRRAPPPRPCLTALCISRT